MLYPAFTALIHLQELVRTLDTDPMAAHDNTSRSFARWIRPEQELLAALTVHDLSTEAIARMVKRTRNAIERRNQDIEAGKTLAASIAHLPLSSLRLSEGDAELLIRWAEPPLRDPLGWQYGAPWAADVLAPSDRPVLRIVEVSPDPVSTISGREPRDAAYEEMTARATWVDVATRLTQQRGQVLLPWPDTHHTQQLAIRETLRRANGTPPPKRTVLEFPFADLQQKQQGTVLIDRPEAWFLGDIAQLHAQIVVLVLPALPTPTPPPVPPNLRPAWPHLLTKAELPALLRAVSPAAVKVDWQNRERLIERWSEKRQVEIIWQQGVPNTTRVPARLDWRALRLLPPSGHVVTRRPDLLLRAAVWYGLTQQRVVHLPENLTHRLNTLLPPDSSEHVSRICDTLTGPDPVSTPTSEAVQARIWADLYHLSDPEPSDLRFALAAHEVMDYIGH